MFQSTLRLSGIAEGLRVDPERRRRGQPVRNLHGKGVASLSLDFNPFTPSEVIFVKNKDLTPMHVQDGQIVEPISRIRKAFS